MFEDLEQQGPAVDLEAVIARNPASDRRRCADRHFAREWLDDWKRFRTLRAVRNNALVPFEDARLSRLGPSALGGTEVLCQAIDAIRRRAR